MEVLDTLRSLVTGLGTAKDKNTTLAYVFTPITQAELVAMHRSDWLAHKVVNIIPNDMTREWRDWQAEGDQIEAIEAVEKLPLINLQSKVALAMQKARLFGGAVLFIGIRGQSPSEPLDLNRVGKGSLEYLHLLHRHEVSVGSIIKDVTSPYYGEPEYYQINGSTGATVKAHPSRMVRFVGAPVLDETSNAEPGWGDSVLQIVYDAVQNATSVQQHIAALIPEAKTDVIYMPGLSSILKNSGTTQQLTDRFTYANTAKSLFNMLLLEGNGANGDKAMGEKWEQKQINFAQLPELAQQFLQIAAGAADIPVTRLLGQSPSGMNATGESDIRNYYDNISARQRAELSPALHRLDEVIIRSALGSRPTEIYFEWSPLYTMSEKEQAEIFKTKADGARAIAGTGGASPALMPIEALSDALVNALVEDGSLPGLDAAIEEFGRLSDQEEDDEEKAAAIASPVIGPEQQIGDARPRTLYVSRKVLNGEDIVAWAKSQGFETTLPASDMHVTIAFSRVPVDWFKVGSSWDEETKIPAGGARMMERLGDATVLLFNSNMLRWRHEEMREAGASWDRPEYQPHITIAYKGAPDNLDDIDPYQGEIVLGPEIFAEVDEDWSRQIVEDVRRRKRKEGEEGGASAWRANNGFDPNQPRGGNGRWIETGAENRKVPVKMSQDEIAEDMLGKAKDAYAGGTKVIGIRTDDLDEADVLAPGSILPKSRAWKNGDPTDKVLDGTSVVLVSNKTEPTLADVKRALKTMRPNSWSGYYGKTVYLVGGSSAKKGKDVGEGILKDAKVIAIYGKEANMGEVTMKVSD